MSLFYVMVNCVCVEGTAESFKAASLENAASSLKESGVVRFDLIQDATNSNKFALVEVYADENVAPASHKETAHYKVWREAVAGMMAVPREATKFWTISEHGWDKAA